MALNFNSASAKWTTSLPLGEYGLYHDGSATQCLAQLRVGDGGGRVH